MLSAWFQWFLAQVASHMWILINWISGKGTTISTWGTPKAVAPKRYLIRSCWPLYIPGNPNPACLRYIIRGIHFSGLFKAPTMSNVTTEWNGSAVLNTLDPLVFLPPDQASQVRIVAYVCAGTVGVSCWFNTFCRLVVLTCRTRGIRLGHSDQLE